MAEKCALERPIDEDVFDRTRSKKCFDECPGFGEVEFFAGEGFEPA